MTANELRIGNTVFTQTRYGLEQVIVTEISDYEISTEAQFETGHLNTWIDVVSGIPLTEDRLLKLGFERVDGNEFSNNGVSLLRIEDVFEFSNRDFPIKIKYVHQLQNLYFALTEEELTIKNK